MFRKVIVAMTIGVFVASLALAAPAAAQYQDDLIAPDDIAAAPAQDGVGAGTGPGALPTTGSDLNLYGLLGVVLLTAGGLVLLANRRRGHATA